MKLANAAKYFDRVSMADAYTGTAMPYKVQFSTFNGQLNPNSAAPRPAELFLKMQSVT